MKIQFHVTALLAAAALFTGCKNSDGSESEVAALANSGFAWPGGRAKVFFKRAEESELKTNCFDGAGEQLFKKFGWY